MGHPSDGDGPALSRATFLLDAQFDGSVAVWARARGYDVVGADEPAGAGDRVLVSISGMPGDEAVAEAHEGTQLCIPGPLTIEEQVDLVQRLALTLWSDESGQVYAMEPGNPPVGEA